MSRPPFAIGVESELFTRFTFDGKKAEDESFYRDFWTYWVRMLRQHAGFVPGVRTDGMYAHSDDWQNLPTILFAPCGGKLYLDSHDFTFKKSSPEWCTPECGSPLEAAGYATIADNLIALAFRGAAEAIAIPRKVDCGIYRISALGP